MEAGRALIKGATARDGLLHHDGRPLTAEAVRDAVRAECAAAGAPAPPDIMVVSLFAGGGHDPGSGPLPAGKPIEIDLWPRDEASGCWADMTRTFVGAGEVTDEIAALRDIAREALEAARDAARPGVTGRATVDAFHAAGLEAGGKDNGAPGVRATYHPNYYGAYVLDPDGNNVEAVCHSPA